MVKRAPGAKGTKRMKATSRAKTGAAEKRAETGAAEKRAKGGAAATRAKGGATDKRGKGGTTGKRAKGGGAATRAKSGAPQTSGTTNGAADTDLAVALETGDLPTSALWRAHAETAQSTLERGVALLECLTDPQLDGPAHFEAFERALDMIETAIGHDDADGPLLLGILGGDAPRFGLVTAQQARIAGVARMVEADHVSAAQRRRYAVARAALVGRDPEPATANLWRIDQGSSLAGIGADVEVSRATAVALAQLRERCAALCSLLPDAAISRFADELDSGHGLAIRSAPNIVTRVGQLVDELREYSDAAKQTLAPVAKRRRA